MKTDSNSTNTGDSLEAGAIDSDLYLLEMNQRLQKLRSLLGEAEVKKSRPKNWAKKKKSA